MSTTTIRIEDDLKSRVATAAAQAGKTAHAFILDAIAQTLAQAELDNDFHALADKRWANIFATGKTVTLEDASADLTARSHGQSAKKPTARKLASKPAAHQAS